MRPVTQSTTDALEPPSQALREEARQRSGTQTHNDACEATWDCLNNFEVAPPAAELSLPRSLTVAAWNMERCKDVEASAELIRSAGADVILATEMDWGMARSGQRHTTRTLAGLLGFGYIFGVEFVELALGDDHETSLFAGQTNEAGLHGNAILSRYPIKKPALLPIDKGGLWYVSAPKGDDQCRIGGRMAMTAEIAGITFASVHLESQSDAQGRQQQCEHLLRSMDTIYGTGPAVIGGDFNTRALSDAGRDRATILSRPMIDEPAFDLFQGAGYQWQTCNLGLPTTRAAPGRPVTYPLKVLDWLLVRGVDASDPRVVPAVSETGGYLSDHEMIVARILL